MRPIDADELLKASRIGKILYFNDTTTDGYTDVLLAVEVEHAPTIEAEPVRHGEWIGADSVSLYCSECGESSDYKVDGSCKASLYCPHCGAKMEDR